MILDDLLIVTDVGKLTKVLPMLIDLIIRRDYNEAAKEALKADQNAKVKSVLKSFTSVLEKIKIRFSWNGITLTTQ